MTSFKRGEVVLVWFPDSSPQTFKKRPAIVVQADGLDTGLPQVLIVGKAHLRERVVGARSRCKRIHCAEKICEDS